MKQDMKAGKALVGRKELTEMRGRWERTEEESSQTTLHPYVKLSKHPWLSTGSILYSASADKGSCYEFVIAVTKGKGHAHEENAEREKGGDFMVVHF